MTRTLLIAQIFNAKPSLNLRLQMLMFDLSPRKKVPITKQTRAKSTAWKLI